MVSHYLCQCIAQRLPNSVEQECAINHTLQTPHLKETSITLELLIDSSSHPYALLSQCSQAVSHMGER